MEASWASVLFRQPYWWDFLGQTSLIFLGDTFLVLTSWSLTFFLLSLPKGSRRSAAGDLRISIGIGISCGYHKGKIPWWQEKYYTYPARIWRRPGSFKLLFGDRVSCKPHLPWTYYWAYSSLELLTLWPPSSQMLGLHICTSIVYLFGAEIQTQILVNASRAFFQLNCIFCHHEVFQESLIYAEFFLLWSYMFVLSATTYIIWFLKLLLHLLLSLAFAQSSSCRNPIAKWMNAM